MESRPRTHLLLPLHHVAVKAFALCEIKLGQYQKLELLSLYMVGTKMHEQ